MKPCEFSSIVLLSIEMSETIECTFELEEISNDEKREERMIVLHVIRQNLVERKMAMNLN